MNYKRNVDFHLWEISVFYIFILCVSLFWDIAYNFTRLSWGNLPPQYLAFF